MSSTADRHFFEGAGQPAGPRPDVGTTLDPWLGELSLGPAGCPPTSLEGRTVTSSRCGASTARSGLFPTTASPRLTFIEPATDAVLLGHTKSNL